MLFKSALLDKASGSYGGITASRNRYGQYFRQRAVPVNPASQFQNDVRAYFSTLISAWGATLTAVQRAAWDLYGDNVPVTNKVGDVVNLSGQNWYVACNVPRLQAGLVRVDDGPTIFNRDTLSPVTVAFAVVGDDITLTFDDTEDWTSEDDAGLICYLSPNQSPSINFYGGPYRYTGVLLGDAITPITSPDISLTPSFLLVAGNTSYMRVMVSRADGRLTTPQRISDVTAA